MQFLMDNLSGIRLFVLVAKLGSFSATARNLHLSVAAVSRQVSALEDSLKVKLFNRGQPRLTLTEAGEMLLRRAAPLVEELQSTIDDVSLLESKPQGTLKVCARTIAAGWLIAHLPRFLTENPGVSVDLLVSNDEELDLVSNNIDVDIRYTRPDRTDLIARLLAPSKLVLVASPAYLARHGTPTAIKDLAREEVIRFAGGPGETNWILCDAEGARHEFSAAGRLRLNEGIILREAIRSGIGMGMMPLAEIRAELRSGELVHILPDVQVISPQTGGEGLFAVYQRSPYPTGKVRSFLAFLESVFQEMSGDDQRALQLR